MAYFTIGLGCLLVGLWQDRRTGLPLGVALVLFLAWPYILPRGLYLGAKQVRKNRERYK